MMWNPDRAADRGAGGLKTTDPAAAIIASTVRGPEQRGTGAVHARKVATRLGRASGQVAGVLAMYEDGRYCTDVLDQLAAARAALDAVGLLVLADHVRTCVRLAAERGDAEEKVNELAAAVRRYVRSR